MRNVKTNAEILLGGKDDNCSPRTILNYGTEKRALYSYDQRREECIKKVFYYSPTHNHLIFMDMVMLSLLLISDGSPDSVVAVASRLRAIQPGHWFLQHNGLLSSPKRPDRLFGPTGLLCNGYRRLFLRN